MSRPEVLQGYTTKVKTGCGALFLTINFDQDRPFEIFLNSSKLGGCSGNQNAIARLLTLCFKNNVSIEDIVDQLQGISCPACTRAKAKLGKDEIVDYPTSCPDAVARFIKKMVKHD